MFGLSLPTSVTSLLKAADSYLAEVADESLAKRKVSRSNLKTELRIWEEVQSDKLHKKVLTHVNREKLTESEQTAVNVWLEQTKD